jgi:hypothetical protein
MGEEGNTVENGTLIGGKYLITGLIGKGAAGCVYQADDLHLGRKAAVKEVLMPDKAAQKALRGEMEMMKELGGSGSGLPEIYDWAEENGRAYLVMEYVDGMTLREYIRWNGRLSEKRACEWGRQILLTLAFLHRQHPPVIYQDLKPSNIIVAREGGVRLIDFGASFRMRYDGSKSRGIGTYGYSSPEQQNGGLIGPRSDVYAWGRLMQEMLSGVDMARRESCGEQAEAVYGSEVSYALSEIIRRCLSEDMSDRFGSACEVLDALDGRERVNRRYDRYILGLRMCSVIPAVIGIAAGFYTDVFAQMMSLSFDDTAAWKNILAGGWQNIALTAAMCAASYFIYENIGIKRYDRIRRSEGVFLTEGKTAGMWFILAAVLSGICLAGVVRAQKVSASGNLPVTVYDSEGRKVLIRSGTVYGPADDFIFSIDSSAWKGTQGGSPAVLTVSLTNRDSGTRAARTYYLTAAERGAAE